MRSRAISCIILVILVVVLLKSWPRALSSVVVQSSKSSNHIELPVGGFERSGIEDPDSRLRARVPARTEIDVKTVPPPPEQVADELESVLVVDLLAARVAGVPLVFHSDANVSPNVESRIVSGANGGALMPIRVRPGVIRVDESRWVAVFEPRIESSDHGRQHILVVSERQPVFGHVVDANDVPVAEASLSIELSQGDSSSLDFKFGFFRSDEDLRSSFPLDLDGCGTAQWRSKTNALGYFEIVNAPNVPGAELVTRHRGYEVDTRSLSSLELPVTIVLASAVDHRRVGIVQDPQHRPIEGAWVLLESQSVRTNRSGAFDLELDRVPSGELVIAFHEDWMPETWNPAVIPVPPVLTLKHRTLTIHGQVVDAQGMPLSGARVRVIDPVTTNEMLEYAGVASAALKSGTQPVGGGETFCDSNGIFTLHGLLPRSYRLRVIDSRTLASMDTHPIQGGQSDVRITVNAENVYLCLAGKLVYADGSPAANVRVQVRRTSSEGEIAADPIRSDSGGMFTFNGASSAAESIAVLGEAAPDRIYKIKDYPNECELRLVVPRHGDLRVEISESMQSAQEFAVLDARGNRLIMAKHFFSGSAGPYSTLPIINGTTDWAVVPDDAVVVVLLAREGEIARKPIQIQPGVLTVLRFD